jgi:hypothetical protein
MLLKIVVYAYLTNIYFGRRMASSLLIIDFFNQPLFVLVYINAGLGKYYQRCKEEYRWEYLYE